MISGEKVPATSTFAMGPTEAPRDPYHIPSAFPFLESLCRVCKSLSTGVHYGVSTCEGCKGFFKRSIPKCQHYKCYFGGDCEITKETRNRCKSCRFQRCLQVGMALEAVKMGRIPKGERERAMKVSDTGPSRSRMKLLKPIAPAPCSISFSSTSSPVLSPTSSRPFFPSSDVTIAPAGNSPACLNRLPVSGKNDSSSRRTSADDASHCLNTETSLLSNQTLLEGLMSPALSPVSDVGDDATSDSFTAPFVPVSCGTSFSRECRGPKSSLAVRESVSRDITCQLPGKFIANGSQGSPLPGNSLTGNQYSSICPVSRSQSVCSGLSLSPSPYSSNLNDITLSAHDFGLHLNSSRSVSVTRDYHPGHNPRLVAHRDAFSPCPSVFSDKSRTTAGSYDSGFGSRSASVSTDQGDAQCFVANDSMDAQFFVGNDSSETPPVVKTEPHDDCFLPVVYSSGLTMGGMTEFGTLSAGNSQYSDSRGNCPLVPTERDFERTSMLERIIQLIDDAGNEVYRAETMDQVEFMVRMWQEGRLIPDSPRTSEVTILIVRDCIKESFGVLVNKIVKFSEKIPGMSTLCAGDAKILMEQCVFEMWMLQNAAYLVNNESYIMLPHAGHEPIHYSRSWMSNFLSDTMINALMEFSDELNSYQLSFLELNLLKAVVIVSEREGLEDSRSLAKLRRVLQEALFQSFKRRQSPSPEEMYRRICHLMPHLARIHELYKKHIAPIDMTKESDWNVEKKPSV